MATPKVVFKATGRYDFNRMEPVYEWETERDEGTFIAHGYWCEIKRTPVGNLNGYVLIGRTHPYWVTDIALDVHGGTTYTDGVKVGFDCAHAGDLVPAHYRLGSGYAGRGMHPRDTNSVYRNWAFVTEELNRLAAQLRAIDTRGDGMTQPDTA